MTRLYDPDWRDTRTIDERLHDADLHLRAAEDQDPLPAIARTLMAQALIARADLAMQQRGTVTELMTGIRPYAARAIPLGGGNGVLIPWRGGDDQTPGGWGLRLLWIDVLTHVRIAGWEVQYAFDGVPRCAEHQYHAPTRRDKEPWCTACGFVPPEAQYK